MLENVRVTSLRMLHETTMLQFPKHARPLIRGPQHVLQSLIEPAVNEGYGMHPKNANTPDATQYNHTHAALKSHKARLKKYSIVLYSRIQATAATTPKLHVPCLNADGAPFFFGLAAAAAGADVVPPIWPVPAPVPPVAGGGAAGAVATPPGETFAGACAALAL
jgi:hypothetical protein